MKKKRPERYCLVKIATVANKWITLCPTVRIDQWQNKSSIVRYEFLLWQDLWPSRWVKLYDCHCRQQCGLGTTLPDACRHKWSKENFTRAEVFSVVASHCCHLHRSELPRDQEICWHSSFGRRRDRQGVPKYRTWAVDRLTCASTCRDPPPCDAPTTLLIALTF
jgi:hypothetical protein